MHIEELYNKISSNLAWFEDSRTEETILDFERYVFEWTDVAEEELHWSEEQVAVLIARGDKLATKSSILPTVRQDQEAVATRSEGSGEVTCNCNSEKDYCSTPIPKCKKGYDDCTPTEFGCGVFLNLSCDGRCAMDL